MLIRYFEKSDMLYIELTKQISIESEVVAPKIVLDFDESGRVVGIEIEDASKMLDLANLELSSLPLANLLLTKPTQVPV